MKLEGEIRIPSGCAIAAVISRDGKRMTGDSVIKGIATMHDRSNGLGGGFAGYGIYPQYKDFYAFHIFYNDSDAKEKCERFLKDSFENAHVLSARKNIAAGKTCVNAHDRSGNILLFVKLKP